MRTVTLPAKVCHCQHLSNAACRKLPRCRSCGRVLHVFDHAPDICHECGMLERARAAADAEKWRLRQAERLIAEVMGRGAKEGGAE